MPPRQRACARHMAAAVACAAIFAFAGCGGENSPAETPPSVSSSATAVAASVTLTAATTALGTRDRSSTPTPHAEIPLPPGFADFTRQVAGLISDGDAAGLAALFATTHVVCTPDVYPPRSLGGPVCDHLDEEFEGIGMSMGQEGGIIPAQGAEQKLAKFLANARPAAADQFGPGGWQVYATLVGSPQHPGEMGGRWIIATAIADSLDPSAPQSRAGLMLSCQDAGGIWKIGFLSFFDLGPAKPIATLLTKSTAETYFAGDSTWRRFTP